MTVRLKWGRLALQVMILALLGACAGGGGGGGGGAGIVAPPPPPPPPPPSAPPRPPAVPIPPLPPAAAPGSFPSTSSQEYLNNYGPGGINAAAAWQYQNAHGEGVLIGVIDDGIDPAHPELAGRISAASRDIVPGRNALTTTLSHGSELSSLIAGNFNNAQTVGVAYQATILAVRADNGSNSFSGVDLANALNFAVAQGVKVVNFSLGSASPTSEVFRTAIRNATAAGVIIVVSAGNDGAGSPPATQPNFPGFLATDSTISNGLILIAGGSNPDGTFNPVSNPAGLGANFYLVAPGWQIIVPDYGPPGAVPGFQTCGLGPNGDLCRIQGTSYASPHVTAAIAVLMSAFPGLAPLQVVQIVLQSTDDMGVAGIDEQTGWGRLNLVRAFAPIGPVSAPLANGTVEIGPASSLGMVGAPFGDGMSAGGANWTFAAFDSFGRTYALDYARNWTRVAGGPAPEATAPPLWRSERAVLGVRVAMASADDIAPKSHRSPIAREEFEQAAMRIDAELADGLSLSFAAHGARAIENRTGASAGHLGLVNADVSLALTQRLSDDVSFSFISEAGEARVGLMGEVAEQSAAAGRASFAFDRAGFALTLGRVSEGRGLLGLVWADALGQTPGGQTRFAGLAGHFDPAPGWRLRFAAETGLAELPPSGWLLAAEPLRTSAFSLELMAGAPAWLNPAGAGVLSLTLAQPLRVEDGILSFAAPVATAFGRQSLSFETRSFAPVPSGRELRLGLGYRYGAGDTLSAFAEALYVLEPGHVARAEPEALARLGIRVRR